MNDIALYDLGLINYKNSWDIQEQLFNESVQLKTINRDLPEAQRTIVPHHFILCQHPPVVTLGKSGDENNLLLSEDFLKLQGIEFFRINRGGDITLHNPGQLVGYPILDLDRFFTDIHKYLRLLEEVIIQTLAEYNIEGKRYEGFTGVWLEPENPKTARKICAMGVRTSRWITMHGFALNINNDTKMFDVIVPCGIKGKQVTSISKELNREVSVEDIKPKLLKNFELLFEATIHPSVLPTFA